MTSRWRTLRYISAVLAAVCGAAVRASSWPRTTRDVLARQILFTGVEALRFVSMIGLLAGLSVVVQAQYWLSSFGQSALLGPLLVAVLIREAGPLLVNFVVIGRSGTAMATELANMRVNGEIRILDAMGLDPLTYLVLPRVIGAMVSVLILTVAFVAVSFASGFACGTLTGVTPGDPRLFLDSVFGAVGPADVANFLAKTLLPGMLTGAICSLEGMSIQGSVTEVPQAATRGVVQSIAALFLLSAIVSVLTYA